MVVVSSVVSAGLGVLGAWLLFRDDPVTEFVDSRPPGESVETAPGAEVEPDADVEPDVEVESQTTPEADLQPGVEVEREAAPEPEIPPAEEREAEVAIETDVESAEEATEPEVAEEPADPEPEPSPAVGEVMVGDLARSADTLIAASRGRTCAVGPDLTVACWGQDGLRERLSAAGLSDVVAVSTGDDPDVGLHVCALHEGGTVSCWGPGFEGQLGQGDRGSRYLPAAVPGISDAVAVGAGWAHTCAVHGDGGVSCWGAIGRASSATGPRSPGCCRRECRAWRVWWPSRQALSPPVPSTSTEPSRVGGGPQDSARRATRRPRGCETFRRLFPSQSARS